MGWWYTFNLAILIIAMYFAYNYIFKQFIEKEKKTSIVKNAITPLIVLAAFFGGLIVFTVFSYGVLDTSTSVSDGFLEITTAPQQTLRFVQEFTGAARTGIGEEYPLWPNVMRTVAELRHSTVGAAIDSIGGLFIFLLVLAGIASLALRYKEDKKYPFYALVLAAWLAVMAYSVTTGVRFHAFFGYVSAFGIAALFGYLAGPVLKKIGSWFENPSLGKGIAFIIIVGLGIAFIVAPAVVATNEIVRNSVPNFDDEWVGLMHLIRDSSERAIITSWWDFGHFFQAMSERSVTFDGAGQGRRIFWVGKTLSTSNEEEAVNILRMLNCGQEESYEKLLEYTGSQITATMLNKETTQMEREEARNTLLEAGLTSEQAEEVLGYSHCDDLIDNYFIVSEDMVGKSSVWGHFGNWNFTRSYAYHALRGIPTNDAVSLLMEETGLPEDKARETMMDTTRLVDARQAEQWISPFPSYLTSRPVSCSENEDVIGCDINAQIGSQAGMAIVLWRVLVDKEDFSESTVILRGVDPATGNVVGQQTVLRPNAVVVEEDDELVRHEIPGSDFEFDLFLFDDLGQKRLLISHPLLTDSMFTRLFFLEGKHTENFELIDDRTTFRGQRILTYKVNFD